MRKVFLLIWLLCLCFVNSVYAADYVLDKELTWDQVKGGSVSFALVSGSDVLYGTGDQNTGMADVSRAVSEGNGVSLWKVETTSNGFMFRGYNTAGTAYNIWGYKGYLNSNPGGDIVFILGNTVYTNGHDMANGAVWTVTATSGGYTIKNVGNNKYLNGTNATDAASKVWKFYSVKEGVADIYGSDAGTDSGLRPIRRYGKNLVYADDVTSPVVLHGVMDTPSAYFNAGRWTNGVGWADYNNTANIAPCLNYFTKIFEAINYPSKGTYCNLFRLHLDPCWLQGNTLASGFSESNGKTYDPHGQEVGGEANIGKFSETKFRARLQDLYIPIIKDAIAHGLYVIIRPPGVFPENVVVGDYYNDYLNTIWNIVSSDSYIKAHAGQISIEMGNEPVHVWLRGTTDFTQNYWMYDNTRQNLYDFFQPIVNTIRSNGFKGIIWAPGTGWQAEYRSYSVKMLNDSNLGFAAHFYPGWYNSTGNDDQCKNSDANVLNQFKTQLPIQASHPIVITEVDWSPKDGAGGHYDEHGNWVVSNFGTWGTSSTTVNARFGDQFKYVADQCGNVSWTLQGSPLYVDIDAYLKDGTVQPAFLAKAKANNVDIYQACSGATFKWFKEYAGGTVEWPLSSPSGGNDEGPNDLTKDMFHKWTTSGADAAIDPEKVDLALVLNEATKMPYGDGNVYYLSYADLSQYGKLEVTASSGEPRFCFNRLVDKGDVTIEFPRDKDTKPYETVKDNSDGTTTYIINLHSIVAEAGFAHLHCIKGANFADVTVTSMKVLPMDNCLKITTPQAKTDVWDWQIRYPLPTTLASGKTYTIEIVAKAANATNIGVWPVVSSDENKLQYGEIDVTTEWTTKSFDTNGTYAYDYLFFNIGKVGGDFMISNIKITDKSTGVVVLNNNMNDNSTWTRTQNDLIAETVSSDTKAETKEDDTPIVTPPASTVDPITEPIELVFTEEGSKTFDIRYFKVSGEGVTIDYNTGLVTATQAGGKIYVEFNNADLSAAQSIKLNVNTSDPNVDIRNTGAIYNNGTSINEWYGSRYNMQDLDKTAKIDDVDQDYIWNEKMGSVTKLEWNIDKAGMMTINDLIITSGVPASVAPDPENPDIPEIAQRRPVDNKHPLWLVHVDVWNNADPQKIIDLIPEDIKPYVAMNLSLSCSYDDDLSMFMKPQNAIQTFRSWASVCCRNNMFFTCQPASGGRGHLPDDDAHLQETLTTMESFFKDYPNFLGWNYAEQFWGFDDNSVSSSKAVDRIRLFSKLVPMHAKYGGFLTISFCGNIWSHPTNPIGMMKRNSDFLNACKANPEATLWLYKYTTSANWYNNESVTIGPFISGLSNNYGVRYDNCGWNGAIDALVKDDKAEYKNDGLPETYPGAVGIAPILEQSALNGACVWDGPELIWTECFQNKRDSNVEGYTQRNWGTFPNFDNIWVDMFRKIIDGTIHIPSRDEVLARTKVVMKNDISANDDATGLKINAYAAPIDLYHDLYWQDDPFNARDSNEGGIGYIAGYGNNNYLYFKKTGRYATIPIVIDMFDDKAKNAGIKVIKRSDYNANHSDKVSVFNAAYPDPVIDEGDLFVARHKNALVCYYPFSDRKKESNGDYKTTSYAKVPLKYNTCTSMDLTFGVFSSAHAKEYSDHIDFYMNNFRDDIGNDGVKTDVIKINGASAKPSYTVVSNRCNATVTENWSNGVYTCTVTHCGPLDLRIKCAGNNSRSPLAMVDDAPLDASSIATADAEELKMQPLVIEGEDFDYKSVAHCVTDAYNYNEGSYRNVLGHAAMGFQDMGTNTAATLRKKTAINNSGAYNIGVKYMSLDASNISVVVNGKSYSVPVDSTANAITDANAWRSAEITAELIKGQNDVVISNAGGKRLMVDNVTFTPLSLYEIAEPNSFDLSAHDFYNWTAADATGTKKGSAGCAYVLNESTGMPYGDGNVYYLNYADLKDYSTLSVTATAGTPRFLFNRNEDNGSAPQHLIAIPDNAEQTAKYMTLIEGADGAKVCNIDLAEILKDYGYVHLHSIKGAYNAKTTVASMKLYKVYGDVNGDGKVGVSDLATLIDLLGGKEHKNAQGDWSGDGKVDTTDVSILVNILLDQNE